MLRPLRLIAQDQMLSLIALSILCFGALVATMAPHQSLVAIKVFGFSDSAYSAIMAAGSILSVVVAVWIGIRTDQRADRRIVATCCAGLGLIGGALVFFTATPWAYFVAHVLIFPISASIFGQLFALARLAARNRPAAERDGIAAAIRALFAVPFVLVLPIWSLAFSLGADLILIYAAVALASGTILVLLLTRWPEAAEIDQNDVKSGMRFHRALQELMALPVVARMLAIASVQAGVTLYLVLLGLILTGTEGRDTSDVALFAGLVAGLEIPFMLAVPFLLRNWSKSALIAAAGLIHAGFLCAFPLVASTPAVWLLILPAAMAAAVTLSVPIIYVQDLMSERPGAGGALIAVLHLVSQIIAAGVFAVGTAVAGYAAASVLGAMLAVIAGFVLLGLDRRRATA